MTPHRRTAVFAAALGLVALAAGEQAARAQTPPTAPATPRVWSWDLPKGDTASDPRIVGMVRVTMGPFGGAEMADRTVHFIRQRNLQAGSVAVMLQSWGLGGGKPGNPFESYVALAYHRDDGLTDHSIDNWWKTPWMSNGIAEARAWMADYIARYRALQAADPRLPDPDRFFFDTEFDLAECCDTRVVRIFAAMMADPRWNTEPVPGFRTAEGAPMTLAQVYAAAGSPHFDPNRTAGEPANRAWFNWYAGVAQQASEGAMNEAVYEQVRAAWPNCRSSDYRASTRVDGQGVPAREITDSWQAGAFWASYVWQGSSDLQSPPLYPVHQDHRRPGETVADASIRHARETVDACIGSFGGNRSGEMAPWLALNSIRMDTGRGMSQPFIVDEDYQRRMLMMLRSRNVREILMWNNPQTNTIDAWQSFGAVLDDVYKSRVLSAAVADGERVSGPPTPTMVDVADGTAVIAREMQGARKVDLRVVFRVGWAAPSKMVIGVESTCDAPGATGTVLMRDFSSADPQALVPVGTFTFDVDGRSSAIVLDNFAGPHVSQAGDVE
ncbi:MAG: hypothetical protein KIT68_13390, partial [Phycisphaeraceae bacterium]|nr:hypothetical protein [Phycisphaeraceae bacterium]